MGIVEKDYYNILSVSKNSSQDEIKTAYRKMAMKYHPDRNQGSKEAEARFKEAAQAYEVLGDPKKRAHYDRFGHTGGYSRSHHSNIHDIKDIFSAFSDIFDLGGSSAASSSGFESFFGQGSGSFFGTSRAYPKATRGRDLRYQMEIPLQEVFQGADKLIRLQVERSCDTCQGTGARPGTKKQTCTECHGSGGLTRRQGFFSFSSPCPTCQGTGRIVRSPCGVCHGVGSRQKEEKLSFPIPPGIESGHTLRLSGKGESGTGGGRPGDLYVEIRVKEDPLWQRKGSDLIGSVKISYLQALLGASVEVSGLKNRDRHTLPIRRGTKPGDFVVLKKEGLPDLQTGRRGDLKYQVVVDFPTRLKRKEEQYLREIAALKGENTEGS